MVHLVSLVPLLHLRIVHAIQTVLTWHLEVSHRWGTLVVVTANLTSRALTNILIVWNLRSIIAVKDHLIIRLHRCVVRQVCHMSLSLAWRRLRNLWKLFRTFPINWMTSWYFAHKSSILISIYHLSLLEIQVRSIMLLLKLLFKVSQIIGCFLLEVGLFFSNSDLWLWAISTFSL